MINTNDFDDRGRCRHHPHIKLRKKKLFGKGWKVLMSACPDCCVDELRRIRTVERANNKRMQQKLDRSERGSAAGGPGSLASGLQSLPSNGSQHLQSLPSHGSQHRPQYPPQVGFAGGHAPLADDRSRDERSAASGPRSLASNGSQPRNQPQYQPPPSSYRVCST